MMKFTEGEEVLAKYPNTSEYYKGKILNIKGDRYKIQFETGTEHIVSESDIKHEKRGRTPTRTSTRIARKSPSKYSPSRRSPSKRSPARLSTNTLSTRRLPVRSTRLAKISLSRIDVKSDKISNHKEGNIAMELDSIEMIPLQQRLKEHTSITRKSTRITNIKTEQNTRRSVLRHTDRAASLPVEKKNYVHDYALEEKERGYSMQRYQDLTKSLLPHESEKWVTSVVEKHEKETIKVEEPQEWGGWVGTFFLIFILPLSIILPQFLCSKGQCKFAYVKLSTNLESYINWHGFLFYIVYLAVLACISITPIGKNVDGQQSKIGRLRYRVNGLLSATLAIIAFSLCTYIDIAVSDYILNNFVQLSVSGWFIGAILALGLYVKAERAPVAHLNIYASTNSKIYNFWQGREINPRIGTLDIKLLLVRASHIGTLIVNIAITNKAIGDVKNLNIEQFNIAALLAIILQLVYIMDALVYEAAIFTSFTIMYEGTGYMTCVSHLLYPFLPTLTTRFILYERPELNCFVGIFIIIFIIGYILYRSSNSQKDEFRKNPVSPKVHYLETILTSRGKKLMLSGLWGYVRHPNYLGDIMMQWSFAGVSLAFDILPYYAAICCMLTLTYRAVRDNRRCHMRYGYAWEQYCSRVKYMILKCIF